jgi:mRNA interferase YafQ
MRTIKYTAQFKRDYKREKRTQHNDLDKKIMLVIESLAKDAQLPESLRDHRLSGNWKDHRDCHIRPNLVLIYRKPDIDTLELVRLGSHSELSL